MIKVNPVNTSAVSACVSVAIGFTGGPTIEPIIQPTSTWTVYAPINPPTSAWPVYAPINTPTPASVDNPTGSCNAGETYVNLTVSTDYWHYKTSWEFLTDISTIMSHGTNVYGNYRTYYEDISCVSKSAKYTSNIKDSYDNDDYYSSYKLYVDDGVVFSGSNFLYEETHVVPSNFNIFMLNLVTYNYGEENSWNLMDSSGDVIQSEK